MVQMDHVWTLLEHPDEEDDVDDCEADEGEELECEAGEEYLFVVKMMRQISYSRAKSR